MIAVTSILAVDPGLATGIAVLRYDGSDVHLVHSAETGFADSGREFRHWLGILGAQERGTAEIVAERFTITSATARNSQAPWSLKVLGMLDWLYWDALGEDPDARIVLQGPAEAKRLIPNPLLKKAGLWHRGGEGHALDAIRHGAYRYARLGWTKPWNNIS